GHDLPDVAIGKARGWHQTAGDAVPDGVEDRLLAPAEVVTLRRQSRGSIAGGAVQSVTGRTGSIIDIAAFRNHIRAEEAGSCNQQDRNGYGLANLPSP